MRRILARMVSMVGAVVDASVGLVLGGGCGPDAVSWSQRLRALLVSREVSARHPGFGQN